MLPRRVPLALTALLLVAACGCAPRRSSTAPTSSPGPSVGATADPPPATSAPATTTAAISATFTIRPSVGQLFVLDSTPGTALDLITDGGTIAASGVADAQGAYLFRAVAPGPYSVRSETDPPQQTQPGTVMAADDVPDAALYTGQQLQPGFGYITTRDGTTLSANVVLPGPPDKGPYPTVVEYSGYQPSDPTSTTFAQLYTTLGYAYVGVNIRGSGCSGGTFGFFEPIQSLDGYDAIETVAAQPWVLHGTVGMVGISYPGISQLFVAATRPPHLAAITPLSVLDDSYRSTLYPGGILNTGFAVTWTQERQNEAKAFGQDWAKQRADGGDEICRANQDLRGQNPDLLAMIEQHPFYDPAIGDPIAPATFVDKINVPVFLAGAWQDEQTGGHFPAMLDQFTSSPHVYATLLNGTHTEALSLGVFARYVEFLDLYVAKRTPSLAAAAVIAPILAQGITGVDGLSLPADDRFTGMTYEQALAAFEADPPVRVLFEEGAAKGQPAGAPLPRFEADFPAWPIASARSTSWFLASGGALDTTAESTAAGAATPTEYTADPSAVPATFYDGSSDGVWAAAPPYHWVANPPGTAASFITAPMTADTVVIGPGSADLWIRSSAPDTDLEVMVSEVRPDGKEVYVQSGWLRASRRALAPDATDVRPTHSHLEADAAPLPSGEFSLVRVELFPVAHAFRTGSRLRVTIDAPGGNRPVWAFDTIDNGEHVEIAHDADHQSKLVLPIVSGVAVPATLPACGALRGQPCRPYTG